MYVRYVGGGVGHYQIETREEKEPPAENRPVGLSEESEEDIPESPTHLTEEDILDEPRLAGADGMEGAAMLLRDADASDAEGSDDGEEYRDSTFESDEGSAAGADGEDAGLDDSGSEDDDLGAEDGERFMDPEHEEGYKW
jgi:hypothetical protein